MSGRPPQKMGQTSNENLICFNQCQSRHLESGHPTKEDKSSQPLIHSRRLLWRPSLCELSHFAPTNVNKKAQEGSWFDRRRRKHLESSPHLCKSLEELKERQKQDGTSLGIVVPRKINTVSIDLRSKKERKEWEDKERALLSRGPLICSKQTAPNRNPEQPSEYYDVNFPSRSS